MTNQRYVSMWYVQARRVISLSTPGCRVADNTIKCILPDENACLLISLILFTLSYLIQVDSYVYKKIRFLRDLSRNNELEVSQVRMFFFIKSTSHMRIIWVFAIHLSDVTWATLRLK